MSNFIDTSQTVSKKILYIKDLERVIGRNRLTLRRWWERNKFPKPVMLNNRLAWPTGIVDQWITLNTHGV